MSKYREHFIKNMLILRTRYNKKITLDEEPGGFLYGLTIWASLNKAS